MQIKFIGTGSGKTQLKRFHTSTLISCKEHGLLIDTGDGVSKALLSAGVGVNEIDSIIISHMHADHFAGFPSLLTQMKMAERREPLNLFVHSSVYLFFAEFIKESLIFPEGLRFKFQILKFDFDNEFLIAEDFSLYPLRNKHLDKYKNRSKLSELKLVSSSFLIKCGDTKLHYTADIGTYSDLEIFNKFFPDYLITEGTHITLGEILNFLGNSNIRKTFITHINDEDEIVNEYMRLSAEEKRELLIAHDGMDVNLS